MDRPRVTAEAPRSRWSRWRKSLLRAIAPLAPPVVSAALSALVRTLRVRFVGQEDLFSRWARGEKVIVAFWHNRLLMMPLAAAGQPVCILVSLHRDGEIATRALSRWGIHVVRGSATRGAVAGFKHLLAEYRNGYNLAVIPDGPRGPRHVAKPGVIHLARATGAPIFPATFAASRAARLRSWDRLVIPLPFTRVAIAFGQPLHVDRHAAEGRLEECRCTLEARLEELERAAESKLAG
jgi:lysophospholipid acyltransferase (LPLAT)-like uncharacterized protein